MASWDEFPAVQQVEDPWASFPVASQEPNADRGYLTQIGDALSTGLSQVISGTRGAFNAATGDNVDLGTNLADYATAQREMQALQTPADRALNEAFAKNAQEFEAAQGFIPATKAAAGYVTSTLQNPGAAFKQAIQSAPNALISLGTQAVGRLGGAALGGLAGIETGPGAFLTGLAGFVGGGIAANTLMEAGPAIYDILNERTNGVAANMTADQITSILQADPTIAEEGLKRGAVRGATIGTVESLGLAGAGRLAAIPERAIADAGRRVLIQQGVNVADNIAVEAALANPATRAAVNAAAKVAEEGFSTAGNVARLAGASAIETTASGVGEGAAQVAAGQEFDPTGIYQEMLGDVAVSPVGTAIAKGAEVAATGVQGLRGQPQAEDYVPLTPDQEIGNVETEEFIPPPPSPVLRAAEQADQAADLGFGYAPESAKLIKQLVSQTVADSTLQTITQPVAEVSPVEPVPEVPPLAPTTTAETTQLDPLAPTAEVVEAPSIEEPQPLTEETIVEPEQVQAGALPIATPEEEQIAATRRDDILKEARGVLDQTVPVNEGVRRAIQPPTESRVTFRQEGVLMEGKLVSNKNGVARIQLDDGSIRQAPIGRVTSVDGPPAIASYSKDQSFRTSKKGGTPKTVPLPQLQNLIADFKKKLPGLPNVEVVNTSQLDSEPRFQADRDYFASANTALDDIVGWIDRTKNQIYLVADSLPDLESARQTLIHEAIGHLGIDSITNSRERAKIANIIERVAPELPDSIVDLFEVPKGSPVYVEELLAKFSETFESADPDSFPNYSKWQKAWDEIKRIIRAAIRRLGGDPRAFDDYALHRIFSRAVESVARGRTSPEDGFSSGLKTSLRDRLESASNLARSQRETAPSKPVDMQSAYSKAMSGKSGMGTSIKSVFEQAKKDNPSLTPSQFLAEVKQADEAGEVLLQVFENPSSLAAAGEFTIRNASGIPATGMVYVTSPDYSRFRTNVLPKEGDAPDPRMAARNASPNIPGTEAAQQAKAEGKETATSQARFQSTNPVDNEYIPKPFAEGDARAAEFMAGKPLDEVLRMLQDGAMPEDMRPGTDNYEHVTSRLIEALEAAAESSTDPYVTQDLESMAYQAGLLRTRQGTETARSLASRAYTNTRLMAIAPWLAVKKVLVEKTDRILKARFKTDPTAKLKKIAKKSSKEAGARLAEDIDGEPDAEVELNKAQKTADRIIDELAQTHSDTQAWKDAPEKNPVRELYKKHLKEPMSEESFVQQMAALGVDEPRAEQLWDTARLEIKAQDSIRRAKEGLKADAVKDSIIAKDSPKLAKMLNELRKKMLPDVKWADIFTDLPDIQRDRRQALFDRIMKDERLAGLTEAEKAGLVTELDKAWQRERRKVFLEELNKVGALGEKSTVDTAKVKASLPRLLRYLNLGAFNSDTFKDAIGPEYGIRNLTAADSKELRDLGQEAWKAPEGIQRNRLLQQLLDKMQTMTGASKLELLESYWISSVLSGVRTQFDTWMAALNGFATSARQAAILPLTGKKGGAAVISEWFKGLGEGAKEAMQILSKGDYSYLKQFNENMEKALDGERGLRPTPIGERMLKEGDWWQKFPAAVMTIVARSMSAADHMNNTATTRGAMAAARALNPEVFKGALVPTAKEQADAREQAIQEMTGGAPPANAKERADVTKRTREILTAQVAALNAETAAEAAEIGDIAAYQNDPTGLAGVLYRGLQGLFRPFETKAADFADDETQNKFFRAIAAMAAVSTRSLLGVRFARFGLNFASNSSSLIPGTYFLKKPLYGRELSRSRDSLILANNLIGAAAMMSLYSLFGDGDDEDFWMDGPWNTIDIGKQRELRSAGHEPLSIGWKSKDGTVKRISYKQWEIGSLMAAVGSMLDKRKYQPDKWKKDSAASHMLSAVGSGMAHVKDLSAISSLTDILGASAYAKDPGDDIGKKINKVSANWVTGLIPNTFKDVDAWTDSQIYKPESNLGVWARGVPVLRRNVAGGRPMLTILGDPVELDRSPWSRVFTDTKQDEGYQALGSLLSRGIWLPQASTARVINKDGDKVSIESLGEAAQWRYQKLVGQKYKTYLKDNARDFATMTPAEVEKRLSKDTANIRDEAANELLETLK